MNRSNGLAKAMSRIGSLFRRSKMPAQPKMYVLVRRDLADNYRMVQGYHALVAYSMENEILFNAWGNDTIAVLGARNLIEMKMWEQKLLTLGITHSAFREPDLDGQITAIACYHDGECFAMLKPA